MENKLVKIINESGLDKTKSEILLENFSNYFEIAADWERKANAINVTEVTQITEMKMAREGRLFLKEKRVDVEKKRKELKESSLREGQTIDAIAKILTNLIIPIETSLEKKEKFAEIQEEKRRTELKEQREKELQPYAEFVPFGVDLGSLDEAGYNTILTGVKAQLQAKIDAEKARIEYERLEKIAHDRLMTALPYKQFWAKEYDFRGFSDDGFAAVITDLKQSKSRYDAEQERIRKDNEQLAKEKAEIERKAIEERKYLEEKAKEQREAAEKKLQDEREAARKASEMAATEKAKLQEELKLKKDAEERERQRIELENKAKIEAENKAKSAPDKEKLFLELEKITFNPTLKTQQAEIIKSIISEKLHVFKNWAIQQIESL